PGDPNTLIWNLGDGFDDINGDYDQVIVAFGEGISPEDITIDDDPSGWVLSAPGGGMLFLQDSYGNGGELSQITFADGTVWSASDIEEMIQGNMSPFSMSMTQVARAFWASLPNESEAASSESSSGGGCDAGTAGTTGVLIAAVIIGKSKKRG
ncbi:MAG: hypothetical protein LBT31_07365, partial [Synergistaceae bacterium]|nr:hypothetical protein [Synergistaceae bacterium]